MPQFPVTEARRRILAKIPNYEVRITPSDKQVTVTHGDKIIASSHSALMIEETRHDPVYYLPRAEVEMDHLEQTEHSTYCPFKGHAFYWRYNGDVELDNFVWSYESPYPEVAALKDYFSFYTDKVNVLIA